MGNVFLLGAGFSRAVSKAMPLLEDLNLEVMKGLNSLNNTQGSLLFPDDIEMWLTYLSQSHPWLSEAQNLRNHALFLDLSRKVGDVLNERMDKSTCEECPDWLLKLVQWWHENQASVVTLNYDTLIERAACKVEVKGNGSRRLDCQDIYPVTITPSALRGAAVVGSELLQSFRLFKLHGSINWFYSGSISFYGETIYNVPVFDWKIGNEREKEFANYVTDKVPLIVPPLTEKIPYFQHETIRTLWAQAATVLRNAIRVFCLGYSLPPTDITMRFLLRSSCPQSSVNFYLANTDKKVIQRFRDLLPDCYEINDQFVDEDAIPKLTDFIINSLN